MLSWFLLYTSMNQPQVYICPLPLEPPFHFPPRLTPLGCHRVLTLSSLCHRADFHWLSHFTFGYVYVSVLLSQFTITSPFSVSSPHLPWPQVTSLCISTAALQIGSSVPSFQIPYLCVNIWYLLF